MKLISRSEVEANLPMAECIALMRLAMAAASRGDATQLVRRFIEVPGTAGKMAMMPGTLAEPACFGIKLVCKYQRPVDDPLGTHVGMVMLFDSAGGIPLAMVEGSALTGIRTAAASGLATDLLARSDASRLAIIGTGEQAARHVQAMLAVRPIRSIAVWGRDRQRAAAFAAHLRSRTGLEVREAISAAAAVDDADIVCTTTSATAPVLLGSDLRPGQHINLVGSAIPTTAEVDSEAVSRSRFFVDSTESALAAAGELLNAIAAGMIDQAHIVGEIGALIDGRIVGRTAADDITMYKSLGISAQDLAAAHAVWRKVSASGGGADFDLLA